MASYTTNLNLKKPDGTENINIADINNNMDTIDAAIGTTSTGTITKTSRVTSGTLVDTVCRKTGRIVNVSGRIHTITDSTVTASGAFFVIPEGFRPASTIYGFGYMMTSGGTTPLLSAIGSNGNVTLSYSSNQYATQVGFSATYAV